MKYVRLVMDEPVGLDGDGLGFGAYSRTLADAALSTPGPLTIGVFGEWGSGKSSLMRMMVEHLENEPGVVPVWFNAWKYEREEHPIVPLIGTLLAELEGRQAFRDTLGVAADDLTDALRAMAAGFSSTEVAPSSAGAADEHSVEAVLDKSLYYRAYEKLNEVHFEDHGKIVVVVDDLDRCFPDRAIRLLEGIKLALSQAGFVFVLGVARAVIEGYLEHRYREDFGIRQFSGQRYLDKIVQLPFYIPAHHGRFDRFSDTLVAQLRVDREPAFAELLPLLAAAAAFNPRATIRLVNNLIVDHSIATNLHDTQPTEMPEVPLPFFAITRALQQRWPRVHAVLVTSEALCANAATWKESDLPAATEAKDEDTAELASSLRADRDLRALLLSSYGLEWLEKHDLRAAATQFIRAQRREGADESRGGVSPTVFLSYSSEDRPDAAKIAELLTESGVDVLWDVGLKAGDKWQEVLERRLMTSDTLIYLHGRESGTSQYQRHEALQAAKRAGTETGFRLIPVFLPGADPSEMPSPLKQYQGVDLRGGVSAESVLPLVRALQSFRRRNLDLEGS